MLKHELTLRISQSAQTCAIHHSRMMFAWDQLREVFPLDENSYKNLASTQISFCDQLIYRFSKLQDTIGNKVFRNILEGLGEDQEELPFIDVVLRLEKLHVIESHLEWLQLREVRNLVTHEYPYNTQEITEGLNLILEKVLILSQIWLKLQEFIKVRFGI